MQIAYGIALIIFFTLATKQLWDIYNREVMLATLINTQERTETALTSEHFLTEQRSAVEQHLQELVKNEAHAFRMEFFTSLDKKATRKTYLIWICIAAITAYVLINVGIIYLCIALVLGLLAGKSGMPDIAAKNALQQYRLILTTLIDWKQTDKTGLHTWLVNNKKYKNMVNAIESNDNLF
jgi:hypothetical protein